MLAIRFKLGEYLKRVGDFPLLSGFAPDFFSDDEAEVIQAAAKCVWLHVKDEYDRKRMPAGGFVGSAAEIWGIMQLVAHIDRATRNRWTRDILHYDARHVVCVELTMLDPWMVDDIPPTIYSILRKICGDGPNGYRHRMFDIAGSLDGLNWADDADHQECLHELMRATEMYGEFPTRANYSSQFSEDEREVIQILHQKIIWCQVIRQTDFVMPRPSGTPMEIWFMLNLVASGHNVISRFGFLADLHASDDFLGQLHRRRIAFGDADVFFGGAGGLLLPTHYEDVTLRWASDHYSSILYKISELGHENDMQKLHAFRMMGGSKRHRESPTTTTPTTTTTLPSDLVGMIAQRVVFNLPKRACFDT
jgi:hypothetical protein